MTQCKEKFEYEYYATHYVEQSIGKKAHKILLFYKSHAFSIF